MSEVNQVSQRGSEFQKSTDQTVTEKEDSSAIKEAQAKKYLVETGTLSATNKDILVATKKINERSATSTTDQQQIEDELADAMQDTQVVEPDEPDEPAESDDQDEYEIIDKNDTSLDSIDYVTNNTLYNKIYGFYKKLTDFFESIFALKPNEEIQKIIQLFYQGQTPPADVLREVVANLDADDLGKQLVRLER